MTKLFEEMKGRIKQDDATVPAPHGPYAYFSRFVPGGQYAQLCGALAMAARRPFARWQQGSRRRSLLVSWRVGRTAPITGSWPTASITRARNTTRSASATSETGNDLGRRKFPKPSADIAWAQDSRTLFYVKLDDNHRPRKVYRHVLGTPASSDVLVYDEPDPGFYVSLGETQSSRYLTVVAHDHDTSEIYLIDASHPEADLRLVAARDPGHEYSIEHHDGEFVILTNSGGARLPHRNRAGLGSRTGELERTRRPQNPVGSSSTWWPMPTTSSPRAREWIAPDRRAPLCRRAEHNVAFDEEAYSLGLSHGFEYQTTTVRLQLLVDDHSARIYDYDVQTRDRVLRKEQEVPSGHDPEAYVTRRLMAPAHDGETVPVSLLYRKDTPLDGSAPVLLYGYGSYGISMPASFSTARLSLVDAASSMQSPHPRRQGKGLPLVHRRPAGKEDEHVQGLHFGRRTSCGRRFHPAWQHRRPGRIGRRHADGAVANMAPISFSA